MRARLAAVGVLAALLSGCSLTPAPLGVITQSQSPRREALQYFPVTAPVVAMIATDPSAPAVRRLVSSGVLARLQAFAASQKLRYSQLRSLLGNDAVVGQPQVGGPPLAVLVTRDSSYLRDLADSRVRARLARRAGEYKGADFFQAGGWAYAIRGPVLLVGRNVQEIMDALDMRTSQDGYDTSRFDAVVPERTGALARAAIDLRPYVEQHLPPAARDIPLVKAVSTAGVTVDALADHLEATLVANTAGSGLIASDLPGAPGSANVRVIRDPNLPTVGVASFADFALAAERALKTALPVTGLRLDAAVERLQTAGLTIASALLAGPAYAVVTKQGPRLVWRAALPGAVERDLRLAARNYRAPGVDIVPENGGFYRITDHGRLVARIGLVGQHVVAGRASAPALRTLARASIERVPGGRAVVRFPRTWLGQAISVALTGTPDRITLRARTEP